MKKDPNPSVGVAPADAPAAVPRRRFGRTGLRLPVLSAGFMRAMQSWQDVDDEQIDPNSQRTMLAVAGEALRLHGPCPEHRRSFAPVAQAGLLVR